MTWALLFLAAALSVPAATPARRLAVEKADPKTPRDGPALPDRLSVAADIDLFAACVSAGLSVAAAAEAVARVAEDSTREVWTSVAALLSVGVSAERAWADVSDVPGLADLARMARLSERSGAALAQGSRRIAHTLRSEAGEDTTARAERAGVLIALPLAVCFLPAFMVLGLAPVVISLGSQMLA